MGVVRLVPHGAGHQPLAIQLGKLRPRDGVGLTRDGVGLTSQGPVGRPVRCRSPGSGRNGRGMIDLALSFPP